jgi:guanosine-3',5'-bis(diphosphate) 3'-pyrophosphohydrolase
VRSVAAGPPVDWSNRRKRDYIQFCALVVNELRGTSPILEAEFAAALTPNSVVQLTALTRLGG